MSDVRLLSEADFDRFIDIAANAFPDIDGATPEAREKLKKNLAQSQFESPIRHLYGLFRNEQLLGGMQFFDFTMNMDSVPIAVGGVGLVVVDFFHKKEKVAKEMIAAFLRYYRDHGAALTALYPFRPDFYKQMGFGFGAKMNQYRVSPASFPKTGNRRAVESLTSADKGALLACYTRAFEQTHGLFAKHDDDFERLVTTPGLRIAGYRRGDELAGYCAFRFVPGMQPRTFDMNISDFVYEDREALAGLLAFFQSQADQIDKVIVNTQDAFLHHLMLDVRSGGTMHVPPVTHETNTAGVGIMYRVVDTAGFFAALGKRSFGEQNCMLKLSVADSFLPENDHSIVVHFRDGLPSVEPSGSYEVEIQLDIAEFSSLVMGVVSFTHLHLYGLAEISDTAFIPVIDGLFATATPPVCMSRF